MSSIKRRADLAIPYVHKPDIDEVPSFTAMNRFLPMVAMFMRSKVIAWSALFISIQTYLSEPEIPSKDSAGLGGVATALLSVAISYMNFIFGPNKPPTPKA